MNVRQFERYLASQGISASSLDAITRNLRALELLPVGGRGTNAPEITAEHAALIILTLAGVSNPNSHEQVAAFAAPLSNSGLLRAVENLLLDWEAVAKVAEIRVCRSTADTTLIQHNGESESFRSIDENMLLQSGANEPEFRIEGVLSQRLLLRAREALIQPALGMI